MHKSDHIRHVYPILLTKYCNILAEMPLQQILLFPVKMVIFCKTQGIYHGIWHTKILNVNFINKTEMED